MANPAPDVSVASEALKDPIVTEFQGLPDGAKNRVFVKQYTDVLPSKAALKRIIVEEKRRYEKARLLK